MGLFFGCFSLAGFQSPADCHYCTVMVIALVPHVDDRLSVPPPVPDSLTVTLKLNGAPPDTVIVPGDTLKVLLPVEVTVAVTVMELALEILAWIGPEHLPLLQLSV
jgi:hypothetical protein